MDTISQGKRGKNITLVPKVLQKRFLIHWLNNLGEIRCSNISTTNFNKQNLCIILCITTRDLYKFIGHCLILLDNWHTPLICPKSSINPAVWYLSKLVNATLLMIIIVLVHWSPEGYSSFFKGAIWYYYRLW